MCDPVTAVTAVSAVVSAYGSYKSSQDQASAYRQQGRNDLNQAYAQELDYRDQAKVKLADQLAALSTRGVAIDSGTPLALMQQSARNQQIDALRIRQDGINKFQTARATAQQVSTAGLITAGAQLLSPGLAKGLSSLGSIGGSSTTAAGSLGASGAPAGPI